MCNYPKFLCKICAKSVSENVKAVQCDLCELWVHIKCNNLNHLDHRYLQSSSESWYCIECCCTIFPFNSLFSNKNFLSCCANIDNNSTHWIDLENDPEKVCSSKYYDIEEMHNIQIPHKNKSLSLFHINACSLNKNFDDLQYLLLALKKVLI